MALGLRKVVVDGTRKYFIERPRSTYTREQYNGCNTDTHNNG